MKLTAALLSTLLICGSTLAVDLPSSPVHKAMKASLFADTWKNGGDETSQKTSADSLQGRQERSNGKKSIYKAALLSAIIPGGGQYYIGYRRTARYFFAAEALTWIGYAAFRTYGDLRRDDYIRFAAIHANAQLEDKSDDYIDLVGFYSDIRDYNMLGRAWDPERAYLPDIPEYHWQWQSPEDQRAFRDLKNRSREAYRRSDFMIGVAIVDRIISVIDAVRSTARMNRRINTDFSQDDNRTLRFSLNPLSDHRQLALTLYPGF